MHNGNPKVLAQLLHAGHVTGSKNNIGINSRAPARRLLVE